MRTIIIWLICLFLFATPVEASRSLSITSDKSSLFGDEEMLITASPSGFATTEAVFIKGAFYQDGSTNYFGLTKNGDTWIKNGDSSQNQLQVKIGDWDGGVRVKCDFGDSGYKGEGDYKLKLGFYYTTSNGTLSSINWSSNVLTVSVSEPDPTPTVTPQPTTTPTVAPTKTATPTAIPIKTSTPTPKPTASPTVSPEESSSSSLSGEVLGLEFDSPTPPSTNSKTGNKSNIFALVLIGLGIIFVGLSLYLGTKYKKNLQV